MSRFRPLLDTGRLDALTRLVARAGNGLRVAAAQRLEIALKADGTPVTGADQASDVVLTEGISHLLPGFAVVSEEHAPPRPCPSTFIQIDPLDGTKEFIAGRSDYAVNLALIVDGVPTAGLIGLPALNLVYRGVVGVLAERVAIDAAGSPVETVPIRTRAVPSDGLIAMVSRSHLDEATLARLAHLKVAAQQACGSALKFCRIAEGTADIYPRLSPTCEWDIAAGHAIVTAAGGRMTAANGQALVYGRAEADFRVPAFIAWGDANFAP